MSSLGGPTLKKSLYIFYFLGELANLNDRKPEVVDPFERPDEADTVTTSTSVFVAQPGSDSSGKKYLCSTYLTVTSLVLRSISYTCLRPTLNSSHPMLNF